MRKVIEKAVHKAVKNYGRVLVGLAHYDKQKKVKGCDCCYCQPEEKQCGK